MIYNVGPNVLFIDDFQSYSWLLGQTVMFTHASCSCKSLLIKNRDLSVCLSVCLSGYTFRHALMYHVDILDTPKIRLEAYMLVNGCLQPILMIG